MKVRRRGRRRKHLLYDLREKIGYCKAVGRSYSVENWLWNTLWTCRRTHYAVKSGTVTVLRVA